MTFSWSTYSQIDSRKIGEEAVNLIRQIHKISKDEYHSHFISKKTIDIFYKYNKDNKMFKDLSSLSTQKLDTVLSERYYNFREYGAQKGVMWEKIEFIDFIIDEELYLGEIDTHFINPSSISSHKKSKIYGNGGWLYWKYNNKVYKSQLGFWYVDNIFWIVKIKDVSLQH